MEEVANLVRAMNLVNMDFQVSSSGFLPGMFVLVAHHDATVRAFAQEKMIDALDKLDTCEDVSNVPGLWELIDRWVWFLPMLGLLCVLVQAITWTGRMFIMHFHRHINLQKLECLGAHLARAHTMGPVL
jgi:hypothetical protein